MEQYPTLKRSAELKETELRNCDFNLRLCNAAECARNMLHHTVTDLSMPQTTQT